MLAVLFDPAMSAAFCAFKLYPITLDTLRECLEREGFTVLGARHGGEALALWEKHRPDLLCLDIMMPQVDGYEVCRQVRAADAQVPLAEALSGPDKAPASLDNWRMWIGLAIFLILFAYVPVFIQALQSGAH